MKGKKMSRTIHSAFQPPASFRSRKMSPMIEKSTIRYAKKMNTARNHQMMSQKDPQNP